MFHPPHDPWPLRLYANPTSIPWLLYNAAHTTAPNEIPLYAGPKMTSKTTPLPSTNSDELMIADAYAVPSLNKAAPDANKPALKKYGDVLPLFKRNEPNFNTFCAKLNSKNSF